MNAAVAQPLSRPGNVASLLSAHAARLPRVPALVVAKTGEELSFEGLERRSACIAGGLLRAGLSPGERVLMMVKPGPDFLAASFGVLRAGLVPVFIDPGLAKRHMLGCIRDAAPAAMIAIRPVMLARPLLRRTFASLRLAISVGAFPGCRSLEEIERLGEGAGEVPVEVEPDAPALIAFTSGSTGAPKGVVFSHRVLHAQVEVLHQTFGLGVGDVHLAILPFLAILGPGLGCTTVLPEMNAARPAATNPRRIVEAIERFGVTHSFGSPTLWGLVARHCEGLALRLPSLRSLLIAGAAVPPPLLRVWQTLLAGVGHAHTPFGATEAVPVSSAPADEILSEDAAGRPGRGMLVGRPVAQVQVRIVRISDAPMDALRSDDVLRAGEVGEIAVRGPVVCCGYFNRPDADRLARIPDPAGPWHRMGDLGYFDAQGRLWFCGRKAERVECGGRLLNTACIEPFFAEHAGVRRVALVGVGARPAQRPVLVVEPHRWPWLPGARRRLREELLAIAASREETALIRDVLFIRRIPLDVRHNAKLLRGELSVWAARRLA